MDITSTRDKVLLTIVTNPFNIRERVDYLLDHTHGNSINDYLSMQSIVTKRDVELMYSLSGSIVEREDLSSVCPNVDDQIVVVPIPTGGGGGGKNTGRLLAMLAIVAVSIVFPYAVAAMTGGNLATFAGMSAAQTISMYSAGALMAGSLLVNAIFPITPPSPPALPGIGMAGGSLGPGSLDQTDTYGWGQLRNMTAPGGPIPKIYGTRRIAGTIINRYIDVDSNDQYYNALMAVHDGQVQGIQNVEINGQDINSFNDVWQRVRLGTRNQTTIEYFDDTYSNQGFDSEIVTGSYVTKTTIGNSAQGLRIEVICPYGLYYTNTQGGLDQTYVEISLEYRIAGGTWSSVKAGQGGTASYDDSSWTSQGFKCVSECETISFTYTGGDAHTIEYRTGTDYSNQKEGWRAFGTVSPGSRVNITGLGRQPTEVRLQMGWDAYLVDASVYFANITRSVSLGGGTGNVNIVGAQNKPVRRAYEVRNLSIGQYEIRAKKVGTAGTTTRYTNTIHLTGLSEIIPDDFAYPYTALLGVRALATSQLSGAVPSITCEVVRSHLPVYDTTLENWKPVRADNPAWACYDILVKPYYTLEVDSGGSVFNLDVQGYDGIDPITRIDFAAFVTWANWCDALTAEGEKRAIVNIAFDSQMPTWDSLVQIAQVGRGMVVMRGTKFSCIVDSVQSPVQTFTVGNIYSDTFKETFLSLEDRANLIEVTWFDSTRGFQRETAPVYGNDWVEGGPERRATVTLYGCTSYNQAYREALYRLNANKHLIRNIAFDVDVDALACQVGDVVRFQHNLPQWGFGGRVVDGTANRVEIDQEVVIASGTTYQVYVRHSDDTTENKILSNSSGSTNILYADSAFTSVPVTDEIYTMGEEDSEFKLFKIVGISRSQELRRTVEAIEYNASMYTEGTPISWNVSALKPIPIATSLTLIERLKADIAGTWVSEVHMTWNFYDYNEKRLTRWDIYRKDTTVSDDVWEFLGSTQGLIFVSNSVPWQYQHSYIIAVCGYDLLADRGDTPDSGNITTGNITIQWKYAPPNDVSGFTVAQDGLNLLFNWEHIEDIDRRGYEIREGASWEGGTIIVSEISANKYTHSATYDGSYTYYIKAIDTSNNYSQNAASVTLTIVGVTDLINVVYSYQELNDFLDEVASSVPGDLSASNVTSNLYWVHSGNTVGLHVPHSTIDVGTGVSKWVDTGTSLATYSGDTNAIGHYISPTRDIGRTAQSTLRLFKEYNSNILYITDLTYPGRTDFSYPGDTDSNITSNSTVNTYYRASQTSPLTAQSWVTYSTPVLESFRYFQRKEAFTLDAVQTALSFTSLYSTVDVPEKSWTFYSQGVDAGGTTFNLMNDFGVSIFLQYMVSCSVVTDNYYYSIKNKGSTNFFVHMWDDAGADPGVPGVVDMFIKGF